MFNKFTGKALLITLGLHVMVHATLGITIAGLALMSLVFIGLTQLVYMLPAFFYFRRNGQPELAKGLLLGMGLTFLLNATCGIVMLGMMAGTSFH
jgi:hypothetical protein